MPEPAPVIPRSPDDPPLPLAVLLSGGGSTMLNLADRIDAGRLSARIELVLASRPDTPGIERALERGLPVEVVARREFDEPEEFSDVVFNAIRDAGADLVCLAGFLSLLRIPGDFQGRVINVHPALLPAFGGAGMYGRHVHDAVLRAGCRVSGCTVHFADAEYDTGPILLQRACAVEPGDTPETLAARVQVQERIALPDAIALIAAGRVALSGRQVTILPGRAVTGEELIGGARRLCEEAHAGQSRASGEPYAGHPIAVAGILEAVGVDDPELLAAALLHDAVEDSAVTADEIAARFGKRVAGLVAELTLPDQPGRSFEQKHAQLAEHARSMSDDAKLLKLADRLHNLRTLHARPAAKRAAYARATDGLLQAMAPWPAEAEPLAAEVRVLAAGYAARAGASG